MSPSGGSQKSANVEKKPAPLASQMAANRITKSTTAVASGPAIPPHHVPAANHEATRYHAYLKWLAAGKPDGNGVNFWLDAEHEVLQRT